ncbi:mucin-2 [Neoarius graeffei]|uniref:mucin-2 n=1 Tax=Neoarius graeffei TaxID=443677 RepID=UPI00298C06B0|nr:mucin-2 [Neoarius graeffei]
MKVTLTTESTMEVGTTTEPRTAEATPAASISPKKTPSPGPTTLPKTMTRIMEAITTTEFTTQATVTPPPTTTLTMELSTMTESTTQATITTKPAKAESNILRTNIVPRITTESQTTTKQSPSTTLTTVTQTTIQTMEATTKPDLTRHPLIPTESPTGESTASTIILVISTTPEALTNTEENQTTPTIVSKKEVTTTVDSTRATITTEPTTTESTILTTTIAPMTTNKVSTTTEKTPSTTTVLPNKIITVEVNTTTESTTQAATTSERAITGTKEENSKSEYTTESTESTEKSIELTTTIVPSTTEETPSTTHSTEPSTTTLAIEGTTITEYTTQATTSTEPTTTKMESTSLMTTTATTTITVVPATSEKTPSNTPTTVPPTKTLEVFTTTESITQTLTAAGRTITTEQVTSKTEFMTESTAATTTPTTSTVIEEHTTTKKPPTIPPSLLTPNTKQSSTTESTKQATTTTELTLSETTTPAPSIEAKEQTTTKETPTTTVTTIFTRQPTQTTQPKDSTVPETISTPTTTMEVPTATEETPTNTPTIVTLMTTPTTTKAQRTYITVPVPSAIIMTGTKINTITEPTTAVPTTSTISKALSTTTEAPTTRPSTPPMTRSVSTATLEHTWTTKTTTAESTESEIILLPRTTTEAPITTEGALTATLANVTSPTQAKTVSSTLSPSIETLTTTTLPSFTKLTWEHPSSSKSSTQSATLTETTKAKTTSINTLAPNTTTESPTITEETPSTPTTLPLITKKSTPEVSVATMSTTYHTATTETTTASTTTLAPKITTEASTTTVDTLKTTPTYIAQRTLTSKTELTTAISSSAHPVALSTIYSNVSQTSVTSSISSETVNAESTFSPFTVDQGNRNLTSNTTHIMLTTTGFSSTTLVPATPVPTLSTTPISPASTTPKEDLTIATGSTQRPFTIARHSNTSALLNSLIKSTTVGEITLTNSPITEISTMEANAAENTAISTTTVTTLTEAATSTNTSTAESTIYMGSPILTTYTIPLSIKAVVQTRMMFNSSTPIPSETLVQNAITALLSSQLTNISDSIKVLNFTYEKISDSSYAVIFTFSLSNISMPEKPDLSNNIDTQVQSSINNALNTLLNEPGQDRFEPKSSNFTNTGKQIEGYMQYSFQDGDTNALISFLNKLQKESAFSRTISPSTSRDLMVTSAAAPIVQSGSAVIEITLVFNSFSPTPSESSVLSAITSLLRFTNLSDSLSVLNFTYESISNTSYAVIFTININNISMPENPELRNDTYTQVENSINNALNKLLNAPGELPFAPKTSNFTSTGKQIEGDMEYSFQYGDGNVPMAFLRELQNHSGYFTSIPSSTARVPMLSSVVTPIMKSGSAVVQIRLVFNSFTPSPSESLVLSTITSLLSSQFTNLSDSLSVLNFTYESISDASYAVIFTININNISMPENPELRNDTYTQVENSINNALNKLLNAPGELPFAPKTSNFTSTGKQIEGDMEYSFQYGDGNVPMAFLRELQNHSGYFTSIPSSTATIPMLSSAVTPIMKSGSAVVQIRLVFNSFTPSPSESLVLSAITSLLSSQFTNLSDSLSVLNFTYESISDTSYAVIFTININNISMPENPELRNDTYTQVENSINNALNKLLNAPGELPFAPKTSNFTSTGKQIEGDMEYIFQYGDGNVPMAFLRELQNHSGYFTSIPSSTATVPMLPSAVTPIMKSGSAVVQIRLVFNSFTPSPSESLVLSTITSLLSSQFTNLSDSLSVLNFTYESISDTSYAVIFTININNISMPENPELRNDTYTQVENSINNALNKLLNAPGELPFAPKTSNFTSTGKQIEGDMEYSFQYGDGNVPMAFLRELQNHSGYFTSIPSSTATVPMLSSAVTPIMKSGSAVVQIRLVFNSFTPSPSESLVLSTITSLLSSQFTNLSDSLSVLNFTYESISDASYAVIFTININNISMPENPELRNDTYTQVENSINNALNKLLNAPGELPFAPKTSNFTSTGKQIEGDMEYIFQYGDGNVPMAFLRELQNHSGYFTSIPSSTATVPMLPSAVTPIMKSGSAVVQIRLVFNSFTPSPSESLVLSAITSLLSSQFTNLSDSLSLLNFTYESISDASYAVIFAININNISMPENPELRNDTYTQVENSINNALTTFLNAPGAVPFTPTTSNFTSSEKQIQGNIEYSFQDGDTNTPINFLSQLRMISGSAVVQPRLVFNSSSFVPSGNLLINAITSLLSTRITNFSDSVNVLNFTYENISDTSYAVIFTININNISMPENPELRNDTYNQVESIINNVLTIILADLVNSTLIPQKTDFMSKFDQIIGNMLYNFQGLTLSPTVQSTSSPPPILGTVLIYIRLVFKNLTNIPSESDVIKAANALLDSSVRLAWDTKTVRVYNPVSVQNVTYQKFNNNSYIISFGFGISNVSFAVNTELQNETYNIIQDTINGLLNRILNSPNSQQFTFPRATFMSNSTTIMADSEFVISGSFFSSFVPSGFLAQIFLVSGVSYPTPPAPTTPGIEPTKGGFPSWALAIIIPCSAAIILIPCWIILCCLLCGCCAALRRRYSRRRSYNVQYTTRNGLF